MDSSERLLHLEGVNLFYVFRDIVRNFWVVILAAASMWMAVSTYQRVAFVPEYTSSMTMVVSTKGESNAFSNLSTTENLASVLGEVFKSDVLMAKVRDSLKMSDLNCTVDCNVVPETNLLTVSVTASSSELAFRTLNSILDNYEDISDYLLSNAVLNVMKEPNVPIAPSNSLNLSRIRKYLTFLAALAVLAGIAFLSAIHDTVQTVQGAKNKIDSHYFGSICHEEKSEGLGKKAALITNELVSIHFPEDFQKLCSRLEYYMKNHNFKVLMVCSSDENEGKSTVVANLALSLVKRGKKVTVVDCDFRKPAIQKIFDIKEDDADDFGTWLGDKEGAGVEDGSVGSGVSGSGTSDSGSVSGGKYGYGVFRQGVCRQAQKLGVKLTVNFKNRLNPQGWITGSKLKEYIESLKADNDYIIVDTPPMLLAADSEALTRCVDASLLVVRQDWTSIADINDCLDLLREGDAKLIGYVVNNYEVVQGMHLSKSQLRSLVDIPFLDMIQDRIRGKKEKEEQDKKDM